MAVYFFFSMKAGTVSTLPTCNGCLPKREKVFMAYGVRGEACFPADTTRFGKQIEEAEEVQESPKTDSKVKEKKAPTKKKPTKK